MSHIIIVIIIIVICLLFGKADTKKEILSWVGLDLSESNYENKKKKEFRKYTIKAMKAVIDLDYYKAKNETQFLNYMSNTLFIAEQGGHYVDDYFGGSKYESLYLGIKKNYIKHAESVIRRRIKDVEAGNDSLSSKNVEFSDKKSAKKYFERLWEKYQYPWPEDWLQRDGI